MITWLAGIVGEKAAKPVLFGAFALLLIIATLIVTKSCSNDRAVQEQADQTNRSGEAIADAAQSAIATIGNRTATDKVVDQAVATAQGNIDNAQDANAVRNAVLDSVCGSPAHRNDPACSMRGPDPR